MQEFDTFTVDWPCCSNMKLNFFRQGEKGIDCFKFLAEPSISLLHRLLVQLLNWYVKLSSPFLNYEKAYTLFSSHLMLWPNTMAFGGPCFPSRAAKDIIPRRDKDFTFFLWHGTDICGMLSRHLACTSVHEHCHFPTSRLQVVLCLNFDLHSRRQCLQDNIQHFCTKVMLKLVSPKKMGLHRDLP